MAIHSTSHHLRALNRRMRFLESIVFGLGAVLVLFLLSAGGASNPEPEVLRAKKVDVIDENGSVRIQLRGGSAEEPGGIFVLDRNGRARVTITEADENVSIAIRDAEGAKLVEQLVTSDTSLFRVANSAGHPLVVAGANQQRVEVSIRNKVGRVLAGMTSTPTSTQVAVEDGNNRTLARMGATEAETEFTIINKRGVAIAQMFAGQSGAALGTFDSEGRPAWTSSGQASFNTEITRTMSSNFAALQKQIQDVVTWVQSLIRE